MVLSHVRQCFFLDSGSKDSEPKETSRALKRSGGHSEDEFDNKEILKKKKQTSDFPTSASNNKGLTIKLKTPVVVSVLYFFLNKNVLLKF